MNFEIPLQRRTMLGLKACAIASLPCRIKNNDLHR